MQRNLEELYKAAELCRAIAALSLDLERDEDEYATAMVAIRELATSAHDRVDYSLRQLNSDPGIGYGDAIRRELDELLSNATNKGGRNATS